MFNGKFGHKRFGLEHYQLINIGLVIFDMFAVNAAFFLALWLRFDGLFNGIPKRFLNPYTASIFPYAVCAVILFWLFRMYNSMWRYASISDLGRVMAASLLASALYTAAVILFVAGLSMLLFRRNLILKLIGMNIMDTGVFLFLCVV